MNNNYDLITNQNYIYYIISNAGSGNSYLKGVVFTIIKERLQMQIVILKCVLK